MIHRQNWLDSRAYLHHMDHRVGRHPSTIHKYRTQLRHLLEWADATPLPRVRTLDPALPTYLVTARADGKAVPLTYITIYKALATVRAFFQFARLQWPHRYRPISESWLSLLQPARISKPMPQLQEHRFYSIDDVRRIARVSVETLRQERGKVAVCMLFLSGMRPDALASIPIHCVDLAERRILQIPQMGVRTKNSKAAITYLLDIPELMNVVQAWDQRLRTFPPHALWYAHLNNDGMQLVEATRAIEGRISVIGDDIRIICQRAGVDYQTPHRLRHGHIVYARNLARNMAEFKAISQNVMHSSVLITDQVYSALTHNDVREIITNLGSHPTSRQNGRGQEEIIAQLTALIEQLKADP